MPTAHKPIPQVDVERGIVTPLYVAKRQAALSQEAVPSEPGEFYSYRSLLTPSCPVFALLKCKSNKARPTEEIDTLSEEAAFLDLGLDQPEIFSLQGVHFSEMPMSVDRFQDMRCQLDSERILDLCHNTPEKWNVSTVLREGLVLAMKTTDNKFGMVLVERLDPVYVQIAACHFVM